ncbi:hypothetical protein [Thiospirillum jenense]|uniref:Uncharacterized protein n=1 Tax=Thiospirillum jenense TaxID=1653858 RepID=A0A839H8A5_9GAMM|nr:hypothetical protein [Thiospirillum jenense]MBB1125391.1 hypothetical protein [Thiospirillum jenense]
MNERQPISPRRRLQLLRAIPDGHRTDAEWDELNELEIMLAPENRLAPSQYRDEGNPGNQATAPVRPPHPSSHPNANANALAAGTVTNPHRRPKPPKPRGRRRGPDDNGNDGAPPATSAAE